MLTVKNARRLDAKAATLPVEYVGWGRFVVASGSTPGAVYHVQADHNADDVTGWDCDCPWGARALAASAAWVLDGWRQANPTPPADVDAPPAWATIALPLDVAPCSGAPSW